MNNPNSPTPAQAMTVPQRPPKSFLDTNESLQSLLKQPAYASRFNQVLGERAPQFISSVISLASSMNDVDPKSIIASCMIAATLDLPIDKNLGFAWIVPYRKDGKKYAQFQMGYKGYVQLALRTCQYARLNVCEVFEGELVKYDKFTGEIVLDASKKTSDKVIGYATYLKLTFGFEHADFWTTDEIIKHADAYSQAFRAAKKYKDDDSPWIANFDDMAKKTVLAMHLRKWGPMSVQIQTASQADQGIKRSIDAEIEYIDNVKEQPLAPQFDTPEAKPALVNRPEEKDEVPMGDAPKQEPTTLPTPPADPTDGLETPHVIDLIKSYMMADGVTMDQVTAHMRNTKMAKKDQHWDEMSDSKLRTLACHWADELPKMKSVVV